MNSRCLPLSPPSPAFCNPSKLHIVYSSPPHPQADGRAELNVLRSGATDGKVAISYSTFDDTATAGADYMEKKGTVTFNIG